MKYGQLTKALATTALLVATQQAKASIDYTTPESFKITPVQMSDKLILSSPQTAPQPYRLAVRREDGGAFKEIPKAQEFKYGHDRDDFGVMLARNLFDRDDRKRMGERFKIGRDFDDGKRFNFGRDHHHSPAPIPVPPAAALFLTGLAALGAKRFSPKNG